LLPPPSLLLLLPLLGLVSWTWPCACKLSQVLPLPCLSSWGHRAPACWCKCCS